MSIIRTDLLNMFLYVSYNRLIHCFAVKIQKLSSLHFYRKYRQIYRRCHTSFVGFLMEFFISPILYQPLIFNQSCSSRRQLFFQTTLVHWVILSVSKQCLCLAQLRVDVNNSLYSPKDTIFFLKVLSLVARNECFPTTLTYTRSSYNQDS